MLRVRIHCACLRAFIVFKFAVYLLFLSQLSLVSKYAVIVGFIVYLKLAKQKKAFRVIVSKTRITWQTSCKLLVRLLLVLIPVMLNP